MPRQATASGIPRWRSASELGPGRKNLPQGNDQQGRSEIEKEVISKTLLKTGGNKSRAAKLLKIERVTLYAKMKELKIET